MSRNKYEEYTYIDYDNIYTYPSTNILINKFNINSLEELKNKEYTLVASKILELYLQPILVNSIEDIYKIHNFLFSDIYWWAGQCRKVNISKNNKPFIPIQSFHTAENYINSLIYNYHKNAVNVNLNMSKKFKIKMYILFICLLEKIFKSIRISSYFSYM